MSFTPQGYELPKTNNRYFKFVEGDNLIRILSKPVLGWEDWKENSEGRPTPIRTPFSEPKPSPYRPDRPVKHFWAFVVWDYKDKEIKIMHLTQATIQDVIFNLDKDEDWGDPTKYDINIKRTGKELETKYSVIAKPFKEVSQEILDAYKEVDIDLEALFTGDDPFASEKIDPKDIKF